MQRGSRAASLAAAMRQEGRQCGSRSGGSGSNSLPAARRRQAVRWQRIGSAMAVGMAAAAIATTVLPRRATAVAMKTLMATAMAGAQTTINNQL